MRSAADPGRSGDPAEPNDTGTLDAEVALLGAILMKDDYLDKVSTFLRPEHFSDRLNGAVYGIMLERAAVGERISPITLNAALPPIEGMTGIAYLAHLVSNAGIAFNVPDYARVIVERSLLRGLVAVGNDLATVGKSPAGISAAPLLEDTERRLMELRSLHGRSGEVSGTVDGWDRHERARFSGDGPKAKTYTWPFAQIGAALDGDMEPGNLYGLLGASGDAKTSLTLQTIVHLAGQGLPALFLSGEQSDLQCRDQIYSQQLGVAAREIKRNRVSDAEFARIRVEKDRLRSLAIRIDEWPEEPVAGIARRVHSFIRQQRGEPCFFAVDHVSMIALEGKDMWAEQVRRAYAGVKEICKATGSIGMVLMHRSSEFLGRRRMRPVRGDVYGKEVALRALDGCVAIYRPAKWLREAASIADVEKVRLSMEDEAMKFHSPDSPYESAEVYSLKTRFGQEGQHQTLADGNHLLFEGRYTRFVQPRRQAVAQVDLGDMMDEVRF
jgi:replicative DNA helicase